MKRLTVVSMAVAAFMLFAAGAAQAGPTVEKATGSIVMSNPKQAIDFAVFEDPMKGNLTYTNFEYADPGSGVWVPSGSFEVAFGLDPSPAIVSVYDFTVDSVTPLSPTSVKFSGTGVQDAQYGPWHGPFEGKINGSTLTFTLLELNGAESYTLNATGTIAGGSVTGTWNDNYGGGRTGTFSIGAGAVSEVFSFTTTPSCVKVYPATGVAKFGYTIPADAPAELAGQPVAVKVTDNGTPGTTDTYQHNFAAGQNSCEPTGYAYQPLYPITAGNLTVHG
jgi:hypothetical protein